MSESEPGANNVIELKLASGGGKPCPVCAKPAQARYRPFCCKRCADLDLGRWLDGSYRIETEEQGLGGDGFADDRD